MIVGCIYWGQHTYFDVINEMGKEFADYIQHLADCIDWDSEYR